MPKTLPRREDVPEAQRWDIQSVYPSDEAWEADYLRVDSALAEFKRFEGMLNCSAKILLEALQTMEDIYVQVWRVLVYARMQNVTDYGNQIATAQNSRASGLMARFASASAFYEPEILAIPPEQLESFLREEPGVEIYRHYFDSLARNRAHVRSAEVEQLISQAGDALNTPFLAGSALLNNDLKFGQIAGENGEPVEVAQGNINALVQSKDRALSRAAWEAYADGYLSVKNTLAACLSGAVKRDVFNARAHNYPSSLDAAMAPSHLPRSVFENLITTFRANLPVWYRYWAIRNRLLNGDLQTYDIPAYIAPDPIEVFDRAVGFDEAVRLICEALQPLGDEYITPMRRGLLEQRWVDLLPNQGKAGMAFSGGSYDTHPFIFINYDDSLVSASILAHELGHSMHSYFTRKHQRPIYARYSMFVAETASNFNQALLRAYLLKQNQDPRFKITVIEEAVFNFFRYLFVMPSLARFELDCHERVERGEALTAESMSNKIVELFAEGFGNEVKIDEPRLGIVWAQFMNPHLYYNFYVYQYATGISAANALAQIVLEQGEPAAKRYLDFLKSGDAVYPLEALKLAGIDMTTPEPIERAFAILSGYIDELDRLV